MPAAEAKRHSGGISWWAYAAPLRWLLLCVLLLYCAVVILVVSTWHAADFADQEDDSAMRRVVFGTVDVAVSKLWDLQVEQRMGSVLSDFRDILLDESQDIAIALHQFRGDPRFFWTRVLREVQLRTGAQHVLACRLDTTVDVESPVAEVHFAVVGPPARTRYMEMMVLAFDGGGTVDRTGRPLGYENWVWQSAPTAKQPVRRGSRLEFSSFRSSEAPAEDAGFKR